MTVGLPHCGNEFIAGRGAVFGTVGYCSSVLPPCKSHPAMFTLALSSDPFCPDLLPWIHPCIPSLLPCCKSMLPRPKLGPEYPDAIKEALSP